MWQGHLMAALQIFTDLVDMRLPFRRDAEATVLVDIKAGQSDRDIKHPIAGHDALARCPIVMQELVGRFPAPADARNEGLAFRIVPLEAPRSDAHAIAARIEAF
jgi:hypothetical protein